MKKEGALAPSITAVLENAALAGGVDAGTLEGALRLCVRDSSLDEPRVLARMQWLLTPGEGGLDIVRNFGAMDAETLAGHVLRPRGIVFKFIQGRRHLPESSLARIYATISAGRNANEEYKHLPDFAEERVLQEMKWWLVDLKFPDYYFAATPPEEIGFQIRVNRFHEMYGTDTKSYESLKISYASPSGQFMHWVHKSRALEVEREIERATRPAGPLCDLSMYSHGDLLLYLGSFSAPSGSGASFKDISPGTMSRNLAGEAKGRYERLWRAASAAGTPIAERTRKEETGEHRLMVAFPFGYVNHFLSNVSRALASMGVKVTRKYCVALGGGSPAVISSFYSMEPFPEGILPRLVSIALYPPGRLASLVEDGSLDPDQANFINAAAGFVHQFASTPDQSISFLRGKFKDSDELQEILRSLQRRIDRDVFSMQEAMEALTGRLDLSKALFDAFKRKFTEGRADATDGIRELLRQASLPPAETAVFNSALHFVESVQRCNFFVPLKQAFAFRLRRGFLKGSAYQREPFAVFYLKGRRFTGFHVRFKDIARGGIRILRPASQEEGSACLGNLFEECYNLAFTQDKKNKDIPEGGAKGVIALETAGAPPALAHAAFKQYVDALLDLIVDGSGEDTLFLGPDEGTADLMDWAARHARERRFKLWRGFTTGKCAELGGVSHIDYGMTTNSVREYVEGVYRKLGLDEEKVTKVQTGGPDGDLGSNEILLSKEPTLAVVDGGGVLYDPKGLDRGELARLAKARLNSSNFDEAKLGPGAFKVRVSDKSANVPGAAPGVSGAAFRNAFHLNKLFRADLFVPCGGRPKSIDSTNWTSLMDESGRPTFKWIVEGANLFITPEARLRLEEKGVLIFKDSSTNKGGVTSSSLEVLTGILLNDREYSTHMVAEPGRPEPEFRQSYVKDIVATVRENAKAEFELLWSLHKETGKPLSLLSDIVSERINSMTDAISGSELFNDVKLRKAVLLSAVPGTLLSFLGAAKALKRMPENYQRALFARTLARKFVYRHGPDPDFEAYRHFVNSMSKRAV